MIEIVARAICAAAIVRRLDRSGFMAINPEMITDEVDLAWESYELLAEAAIEAMRECSDEMVEAGAEAEHEAREVDKARFDTPEYVKAGLKYRATAPVRRLPQTYKAMIEAALKPHP